MTLRRIGFWFTFLTLSGLVCSQAFAQPERTILLEREVAGLEKLAGGRLGVAAHHVETGQTFSFRGTEAFPMASTFKVAIAVELLRKVDRGELSLAQMVDLKPSDLHFGSGTLSNLFDDPGVALSLRNLLELMMLISDNSATDLLLDRVGGGAVVTSMLRGAGINGMRIDRPTSFLIFDWIGVRDLPPEEEWTLEKLRGVASKVTDEERESAGRLFDRDLRDTSTPESMAALLLSIFKGNLLSEESTGLLLDVMRRCQTGEKRIKGMLPPTAVVAHKTGTIGGTTNDVGILTLPEDRGHVALAVFIKQSKKEAEDREAAIAQVARAIYDFYLFAP